MTTQLLIYETVVPVSSGRHAKCAVESGKGFAFSRKINSVPLMAVEFPQATPEYAVVFAQSGDDLVPVVILGARQNENLYLTDEDAWQAKYVPAFIRRYPFVFSGSDDGNTFTLCVDEAFQGLNYQGRGQALFTEQGQPTPYVDNVLKFLQEYRTQFVRTQAFCKKLKELDLLEPMQAQFTLGSGEKMSLAGFLAVDRKRLKALPAETLQQLAANDELELIYLHLQSMRNFIDVKDRLVVSEDGKGAAEPPPQDLSAMQPPSSKDGPAHAGKGDAPLPHKRARPGVNGAAALT
jgi:hypothetical protein